MKGKLTDGLRGILLRRQHGRAGWILLWLLGVPLPILQIFFVMRGCT